MTALAIALSYLGTLAFSAFVMWMRAEATNSKYGWVDKTIGDFGALLAEHSRSIADLTDKINGLQLQAGLRGMKPKL